MSTLPRTPLVCLAIASLLMTAMPGTALSDAEPRLSAAGTAGCGLPAAAPPTRLSVAGLERAVITRVPKSYDPKVPHSLVLGIHGRTNSNDDVRGYFDLERHAKEPTIFAYPSGRPPDGGLPWTDPGDPGEALRDYALIDRLIEELSARYCLNPARIFAVGHSLGAWFVSSLGCARATRFRAIAAVAGGVTPSHCTGPLAAFIMHNPKDRLVPHRAAKRARDLYLQANGFAPEAAPTEPRDRHCVRYGPEDTADPVIWCPHREDVTWRGKYYPHQWPRGTGAIVMSFFASLP